MFFLCSLLIITWSYFECQDEPEKSKNSKKKKRKKSSKKSLVKSSSDCGKSNMVKFHETL